MIKMKIQSWLLLAVLAVIVAFAAGIRQGMSVERRNVSRQELLRTQSITITPSPTQPVEFTEVVDEGCDVRYLLPHYLASSSGTIVIRCDTLDSSASAKLQSQGYTALTVASAGAKLNMWVKAPKHLETLLLRTIQSNSVDE